MRYIRTKDGRIIDCEGLIKRYELHHDIPLTEDENFWLAVISGQDLHQGLARRLAASADTIPELCDEFVCVKKSEKPITVSIEKDMMFFSKPFRFMKIEHALKEGTIYGAIWTDKGLIYVAKMKGILPNGEIDWELL